MYPQLTEKETSEKLADFFNNISNEALNIHDVPTTYDIETPTVTPQDVSEMIKENKKPKSRVDGDIFVNVLVDVIDVMCEPISKIYNKITETKQWPVQWKTEQFRRLHARSQKPSAETYHAPIT